MLQQQKRAHECPECGGPLKKTIGAMTRAKFWECINGGAACFREKVSEVHV